jgi:uncharacterized protein (UPF0335 family)
LPPFRTHVAPQKIHFGTKLLPNKICESPSGGKPTVVFIQHNHFGFNNSTYRPLDPPPPPGQRQRSPNSEYEMSDIIQVDQLRLLIERIERLEEEKKGIADDIKDVYGEAKAVGYDPKIMRQVIRLRKMERHVREETEALLDTYKVALGLA